MNDANNKLPTVPCRREMCMWLLLRIFICGTIFTLGCGKSSESDQKSGSPESKKSASDDEKTNSLTNTMIDPSTGKVRHVPLGKMIKGAITADQSIPVIRAEIKRFQGSWTIVAAESNGKSWDVPIGERITFRKDVLIHRDETGATASSDTSFRLDSRSTPKAIDRILKIPGGPKVAQRGVYAFKQDRLRICWQTIVNAARPDKIETVAGDISRKVWILKKTSE